MARDFLEGFEVAFPGAKAAYNGRAYYTWSPADPYAGGAYSYFKVGQYTAFNGIQGRRTEICTSPASTRRVTSRASWRARCAAAIGAPARSRPRYPPEDQAVYGIAATSGSKVWSGQAGSEIQGSGESSAVVRVGLAVGGGLLVVPEDNALTAFGD
jgi:hypothetical protein